MTKKALLKKKLAMLDINPLPRFGVQKKGGKIRFSTPIQPVRLDDIGSWGIRMV